MLVKTAYLILEWFNYLVLGYFVILNIFYLLTTIFAFKSLKKYSNRLKSVDIEELLNFTGVPPITLIAPAYNEENTCVESINSFMTLKYPDYNILVVNDGSTDKTIEKIKEAFELEPVIKMPVAEISTKPVKKIYQSRRNPNLMVIDKENGGKSDALNSGINYCRTPYFCAIDADTLLDPDALLRIIRPFFEESSTVAAGGIRRIVNGCRVENGEVKSVSLPHNFLAKFQVLEYLRAFLSGRMGWDALNSALIISGAVGIFKRGIVAKIGGYSTDTVGEDMELVVRMHRYCRENNIQYKIGFIPDPVAWTECPETLRVFGRQRDRWQRGLMETLSKHRIMMFNPRYGKIGFIAYPYFYFLEMLGPIIEFLGYFTFIVYILLGLASYYYLIAFLMVAFVFGIVLSVSAVGLEELTFRRYPRIADLFQLFLLAVLENFGFRQICTFFRIKGSLSALFKKKGWGEMDRKGFKEKKNQTRNENDIVK